MTELGGDGGGGFHSRKYAAKGPLQSKGKKGLE